MLSRIENAKVTVHSFSRGIWSCQIIVEKMDHVNLLYSTSPEFLRFAEGFESEWKYSQDPMPSLESILNLWADSLSERLARINER